MDAEKVAFWGIVLKPGEAADLDLDDGETLRVTSASYGEELGDSSGRSVITASIRPEDGSPSRKYAVAVLSAGKTETVTMDVLFIGEENVSFEVTGKNPVHLVGNFTFENDLDDEDSEDDNEESHFIGLYEDTIDSENEDDDEQERIKALPEHDKPVITEIAMEDDDDQDDENPEEQPVKVEPAPGSSKRKKGKKGKVPNGDSAGPTKKVADASAEPITKALKQTPGKASKGNESKGTEDEGKSPNVASQQKKSSKKKKKKSGVKKEVSLDAGQTESPSALAKATKVNDEGKTVKEEQPDKTASDADLNVDAETPAKDAPNGIEGGETTGKGTAGDDVVPSTKKGKKRRRKQNATVSLVSPEQAPTPPSAKKNKVSERVATPAPPRMAKMVVPSKPNGEAQANGVSDANEGELKTPSTDAPSSKKRKRVRKKKGD
ncbi:FK506-binding protein [Gracilaria domingensis]|nr:FK506-binding protein [Gracilaria domingensis]